MARKKRRKKQQARHSQQSLTRKTVSKERKIDLTVKLDRAISLHERGQLKEAAQLYEQILEIDPMAVNALRLLGVLAWQTGQNRIAIDLIRQAISINPKYAVAYKQLGSCLKRRRSTGRSH